MLGVISFALGLTDTKSSWPGDINLRVASLLDGLKHQVSGDRNQAGSEFWQFPKGRDVSGQGLGRRKGGNVREIAQEKNCNRRNTEDTGKGSLRYATNMSPLRDWRRAAFLSNPS